MTSTKWTVFDTQGRRHQPPTPRKYTENYYVCGNDDMAARPTERLAVLAWALSREIDVAEVVAPFHRSMRERCEKAIDNLWERVRLMGEVEGGNATGGTVSFVIDDARGVEEEEWGPMQCDDALEGIRLAASALQLMNDADPGPVEL